VSSYRAEFEENLLTKMKMQEFLRDATLVLANQVDWNPIIATELVMQALISKLPGEPWKLLDKR